MRWHRRVSRRPSLQRVRLAIRTGTCCRGISTSRVVLLCGLNVVLRGGTGGAFDGFEAGLDGGREDAGHAREREAGGVIVDGAASGDRDHLEEIRIFNGGTDAYGDLNAGGVAFFKVTLCHEGRQLDLLR